MTRASDLAKTAEIIDTATFTFRNKIINGAMEIDQRYVGTASANTINTYVIDRWAVFQSPNGKLIAQQNAGSVTPPPGFKNYFGVTSQSAYTVSSTDYELIEQRIEGNNIVDLAWGTANARSVTLSFWVRCSLTGTFGGSLRNASGTRSYPFTYTISSANTWEYKTVTIPGETSGTWSTDTGVGMSVMFGLGVGTTYSGTAGSWGNTNYISATGATSVVGTNGATFYLTGVQLEVGSVATPFERRHHTQELALCQRYYEKSYNTETRPGTLNTGVGTLFRAVDAFRAWGSTQFIVTKRAAPSVTLYSYAGTAATVSGYESGDVSAGNWFVRYGNAQGFFEISANANILTTGNGYNFLWVANAEL